ncbi:DUF6428 family protein [Urechidicola croceus]|uniref:Uncharacterized protein n=1 Tax=Urechidicola croceus TaxID=1850246 RepID=A0A1D8P8S2_9FLAO|nr:DUF6428 family protein [Urechidicola croceus]AOW20971.1 hypothetical protein LPB138_09915 [Urechidicola croceus]
MKTQEFLSIINDNKDKALLFEYSPNLLVGTNYHITEVKHISIDSVDCGAQTDSWKETIIQLWESPSELGKTEYMSAFKALGILNKVAKMKSYNLESEIKIEYGNTHFHTAQLYVQGFVIKENNLIFKLSVAKTDCKAKEICGIPETNEETLISQVSCSPNSGCC